MRKILAAIGGSLFATLLIVAAVAAANPTTPPSRPGGGSTGTVAQVLGLTQTQLHELRQDGLSLAQIAARQKVSVSKVVDALVARWTERIQARLDSGAITQAEAATLKAQLRARAQEMVDSTAPGGMQGAAVGAGPRGAANGSGFGAGPRGDGTCDGSGPHGPGA